MERCLELEKQKADIESEIQSLLDYLDADGMPGLKGPLVDEEGFPRADIDIYSVRQARNRIACLKNDHKAVMSELETALHTLHATSRISVPLLTTPASEGRPSSHGSTSEPSATYSGVRAFAIVESVSSGSPAEAAGLKAGDAVLVFGSLSLECESVNSCFEKLHSLVKEGAVIPIHILRSNQRLDLQLLPRPWAGQGLLGCRMKPTSL